MPKATGRLSEKAVLDWFSALDFERQSSILGSLQDVHGGRKQERIDALRRELEALEGANGHAPRRAKTAGRGRGDSKLFVKYRDPKTGETWSGRGRMARWLAEKVEAGEKADKYLA